MEVAELELEGQAHAGAVALKAAFPEVVFTSGRRGVQAQAHAMASNIVKNRAWILETYRTTAMAQELQSWVNRHGECTTVDQITAGLVACMSTWTDADKALLSRHFSGQAFDVQPFDGGNSDAIKAFIRSLSGIDKFLEREGGLVRWHAQFN